MQEDKSERDFPPRSQRQNNGRRSDNVPYASIRTWSGTSRLRTGNIVPGSTPSTAQASIVGEAVPKQKLKIVKMATDFSYRFQKSAIW